MKLRWAEPFAARVGGWLMRLLAMTWRYHERGAEHYKSLGTAPFIFVLWHSRILPLLYYHRNTGLVLLVSQHRDGGHLVNLAVRWGYRAVRGSSRRGGAAGLLGIVRELRGGARIAITPDGPVGPAEQVKPGAIAAAQHAGAPIVPAAARTTSAWWLRSWDRFCIPKPFARIEVVYGEAITVPPGNEGIEQAVAAVERGLQQVTYAA
jgi:lysophospholipid acyltransferase (LPLAT)-like uncharacterized protein